jgi:hypothetical protein
MSEPKHQIDGSGLAGGVIAAAMLDMLRRKNILSLDECRQVLNVAMKAISPDTKTPEGLAASQAIAGMLNGQFSAREENE